MHNSICVLLVSLFCEQFQDNITSKARAALIQAEESLDSVIAVETDLNSGIIVDSLPVPPTKSAQPRGVGLHAQTSLPQAVTVCCSVHCDTNFSPTCVSTIYKFVMVNYYRLLLTRWRVPRKLFSTTMWLLRYT